MAKAAIYDYSTTAASNTDIDGVDSTGATGLVKSGDNYTRSVMAHAKGFANDLGAINTVGGTADAITVTLSSAPSALVDGMRITINASAANTGATTLNVTPAGGSAFGAKKVMKWSAGSEAELSANDIPAANALIELIYDSARNAAAGAWMLLGTSVAAATTSAAGIVELATTAETETGTDATRAVTPDGLHDMTTLAGAAWFLDEDTMSSDSAVKVPSQQSVKAYVDASGGLKLLTSGSVSAAATLDIPLTSYTSYRGFRVVLTNIVPVTDTIDLWLRVSTDGGSNYDAGASDYRYSTVTQNSGTTAYSATVSNAAAQMVTIRSLGNGSSDGGSIVLEFFGQTSTAFTPRFQWQGSSALTGGSGNVFGNVGVGRRITAQDTDAIRFLCSSGNIASGSYAVYGFV